MTCSSAALPVCGTARDSRRKPLLSDVGSRGWERLLRLLLDWNERGRQRRALELLDERLLRDIGLTRAEVDRESQKSFWQR